MVFKLLVIGTSLGGVNALKTILGGLPGDFPLPIAVVQHRHRESDGALGSLLQQITALQVCEAEDKDDLLPGHVYLAPADYHLLVESGYVSLSTEEPVLFARPSIDVLFESAADAYGAHTIGMVLTGANHDGAQGLARIKACGGWTIVQTPDSAECKVMPEAAIKATIVDAIVPLVTIAAYLIQLCDRAVKESVVR